MIRCEAVIILFVLSLALQVHAEELNTRITGNRQQPSVNVFLIGIEPYEDNENNLPVSIVESPVIESPISLDSFNEPEDEFELPDAPRWFSGQVTGGAWLSGVEGHLHTPAGGQSGTTSSNRPTVEETGLDGNEWMPSLDARLVIREKHEWHVSFVGIERDGSDVLQTALISQAKTFPAGSTVNGHLGLDTYRLGYRPLYWQRCFHGWKLTPEAGVGMARFEYLLNSPSASGPVDRCYNVGFPYLGFLLEKPFGERFQFEIDFAGCGGINGVSFIDSELRLIYDFYCSERFRSSAVVGWRGLWFRRHDSQTEEQNDPNLQFGRFSDNPLTGLTLGLRIGF